MGNEHSHDHTHGSNKKALTISFIIITIFMIIEAIGGFWTRSLALLSDAGHMLSDAISLGVGVVAFIVGEKMPTYSKTYGYKRFEILAALFNGVTLIVISLYIFYEAVMRFVSPEGVASTGMLIIAVIGLIVNILVTWILMRGGDTEGNLNLRAAFLHAVGDMLGSIGAIIAAILIMLFGWEWADPVASVIVAVLILISGFRVARDAVHVLMEGKPKDLDLDEVAQSIESLADVISVHSLHVWSITSDENALSCHVVVEDNVTIAESQPVLRKIEDDLADMGIQHVTIQLENTDHPHSDALIKQQGIEQHHSE